MTATDIGRTAETPKEIPAKGWKDVFVRAFGEVSKDSVGLVAAGIAFYGFLAIFPAISAIVAISGIVFEPNVIDRQFDAVVSMLPDQAAEIIVSQVQAVTGGDETSLGFVALVGIGIALWSASKGVGAMMEGVNIAYDEEEKRGTIRLTVTRLALTLALTVGLVIGLTTVVVLPSILSLVALGPTVEAVIGFGKWIVLLAMTYLGLLVLYRFAPSRDAPEWRWVLPGALFATVAWVAASGGFAFYVQNFGSYQETFGTLAGVVILQMWLWISAYVVLFGAEVNGEAEAQTRRDTTIGQDQRLGSRDAVKADTVGEYEH